MTGRINILLCNLPGVPARQHSFRIGKVDPEQQPLSLRELSENVATGIRGETGNRRGVRAVSYDQERGLLYLKFIKEISTEITTLNEKNEDTDQEVYPRRVMKFILSSNGVFLYESVQGVTASEAIAYLSDYVDESMGVEKYEEVSRKTMLEFAEEHLERVKKFKVDEIGEFEPNPIPIPSWLQDIIEEFGDVIDNSEASVGRDPDANAIDNELSGGFIATSDPQIIRGEDYDEQTEELNSSGIYRSRYDDVEMSSEEEANYVMNKVDSVFGDMLNGDASNTNSNSGQSEDSE